MPLHTLASFKAKDGMDNMLIAKETFTYDKGIGRRQPNRFPAGIEQIRQTVLKDHLPF